MYFPNGGVASITTVMTDGQLVEVATVGDEGLVGIEAFFEADAVALGDTMMQVPGASMRAGCGHDCCGCGSMTTSP